ncbi:MAG TPA: ABC transporter ATP-binding protein [Anaerolineales bacterium]|nr:ABC transporter ATP-binding protein [Anaerolineales bacterium]
MIQVEGLTKYYGRNLAIQGLTFDAEAGEILGFLGPNGAGKTTTMRILAGYMPPSSGSARVAGFDVVDQSLEVRRRVGYLPETVPLYPEMSVSEYLTFMGSLRRVPNLDDRVEQVIEDVRLEERSESFIGNLSKGLRQRVGVAQALLHKPEVLILDEPTIGLDPAQIIEVRKLIQELGKERTVLLSTHILSEAQQVCDRVLIINRGQIVAEDTPANLQAQLAGGERLRVQAAMETRELIDLLRKVPGVTRAEATGVEGVVELASAPGHDIRPHVARRVVEGGFDLLEIRPVGISLEEIFLELTREEASAEAEGVPGA